MGTKAPLLDDRTSEDIYKQALELARSYCPGLALPDDPSYFDSDDPGLVILKLFSKMTEFLINQMNRIPDKHYLAFLDFMGLDLLAARPARVPLTFNLAEGSSGTFVPSRTAIASSEDPEVVFEMTKGLNVSPARLDAAFSINPWEDRYIDHSRVVSGEEGGFRIFREDIDEDIPKEKNLDHILYLGDDILFDIRRKPEKLDIHFEGSNLTKDYFGQWCDGNNNPIKNPKIIPYDNKNINVSLDIQKLERSSIDGIDSFWLAVRPDIKIITDSELPKISEITASITVEQIIPDAAFFNNTPIDVKKGFYPFGEEPKIGDTLYIGSEEAFSKEGAEIALDITTVEEKPKTKVQLKWEYWNGNNWEILNGISEETENFKKTGLVKFTCPPILPTEINGQLNRWIRVRIESGGYGTAGKLEQKEVNAIAEELFKRLKPNQENIINELKKSKSRLEQKEVNDITKELFKELMPNQENIINALKQSKIGFGFRYIPPEFNPPFIKSIKISYSYEDQPIGKTKTFNNFQYQDFTDGEPYKPKDGKPALYLGFKENISNTPITLFFAVKEKLYSDKKVSIKENQDQDNLHQDEASGLTWKYSRGDDKWVEFGVEDETDFFRTGGIVSFIVPSDITKTFEFGKELYWIKAEIKDGNWVSCPKLKGIFPNTIWAFNSVTVENEVLGSGNGEPGLSLFFSKKPVLEEQVIEVKEAGIPSKDELKVIELDFGKDALRVEEESGEVKEVWVRWQEVRDFAFSGPLSRHYILDRTNGKITFGDGNHGMIPPKGKKNIVASLYRSGGGKRGNVAPGIITLLKTTIPNIESVTNHVPSFGGMDQENRESVVNRGPYTIKNRNRAVTKEDFEWLSKEASQYVAKARCIVENGKIKVVIVPKYEYDAPLPEAGLLDTVERYLKERAFATILNRIEVIGPAYKKIDVNVTFKPVSIAESSIVSDRIKERLKVFLHPLKGGQDGQGWDFGEDIYISEMAAVIEAIDGVDYVKELELKKEEKVTSGVGQIEIESNALPCAGNIEVKINSDSEG